MSAQILLQGRLLGVENFLSSGAAGQNNVVFEARTAWVTLLGEVLPRALLSTLQLPLLLLGTADRSEFLVILPDQDRADAAHAFLQQASSTITAATNSALRLIWSATENLGDWTVVRKRLNDGLREQRHRIPLEDGFFAAFEKTAPSDDSIPAGLREARTVGFSFDFPALIAADGGEYHWDLSTQASIGNISLSRHQALADEGPATTSELAKRSKGHRLWGVLRGEFDDFALRLRRVQSVEEYVTLALLYKQFLSGELELLCSQPDYFQCVTVLYATTSGFAVYGSWDALAGFAQELERVFARFTAENLKELPGGEAKTISMALRIADADETLGHVYELAGRDLEVAKSSDKDCIHLLGRVLEWRHLGSAAELKDAVAKLTEEFRTGRQFVTQLRNLYKKVETAERSEDERLRARALRFQRQFARAAGKREKEFQKLRSHLMKEMTGKNIRGRLKLRPEGLVAMEWARLSAKG